MIEFDTSTAPIEVGDIYSSAFAKGMSSGLDSDEACRAAMRSVAHAGWYQTKQGWKRLGPDVRDKVNLRKAEKQPDGNYVVRDVDVFYPNAVKADNDGVPMVYTASDIRRRIANTNAAIANGGQPPPLSKGHPHILQKANGIQLPAVGRAINWRESPRRPGMARCDLVDVPAPVIENEWAKGHWTGLSAGLVSDANKTNERFGHVALLGVDSQALSHLPTTEVFSVDQCLFSADPDGFASEPKGMSMKDLLIKMAKAQMAFAAASASLYADEEGAESKVTDAFSALTETMDEFNATCGTDKDGAEKDGNYEGQEPQKELDVPEEPDLDEGEEGTGPAHKIKVRGKGTSASFASDNDMNDNGQFAALSNEVNTLRQTVEKQNALIGQFKTLVGGMGAKVARQEFSAFVSGLVTDGHEVDQAAAMDMFSTVVGNKDGVEKLKNFLKKTPKSKLSGGTVFGSDANSADASANGGDFTAEMSSELTELLSYSAPGMTLTDDDMALAAAMSGKTLNK